MSIELAPQVSMAVAPFVWILGGIMTGAVLKRRKSTTLASAPMYPGETRRGNVQGRERNCTWSVYVPGAEQGSRPLADPDAWTWHVVCYGPDGEWDDDHNDLGEASSREEAVRQASERARELAGPPPKGTPKVWA